MGLGRTVVLMIIPLTGIVSMYVMMTMITMLMRMGDEVHKVIRIQLITLVMVVGFGLHQHSADDALVAVVDTKHLRMRHRQQGDCTEQCFEVTTHRA